MIDVAIRQVLLSKAKALIDRDRAFLTRFIHDDFRYITASVKVFGCRPVVLVGPGAGRRPQTSQGRNRGGLR